MNPRLVSCGLVLCLAANLAVAQQGDTGPVAWTEKFKQKIAADIREAAVQTLALIAVKSGNAVGGFVMDAYSASASGAEAHVLHASPAPVGTPAAGAAATSPETKTVVVVPPGSNIAQTIAASAAAFADYPLRAPSVYPSLLDNNMIVAYYGNPFSTRMGILGEQSIPETANLLKLKSAEYDVLNGEQNVVPAFHLIYATVWEDANVGYLSEAKIKEYVDYAAANDMIVILDHQLGKFDVAASVTRMLPWLKYPNVHLAIDPEWKTVNPGKEIGSIKAEDVNVAQQLIEDYLEKEGIEQKKIFIVHQFNWRMISNREQVRSDFPRVDLIHNADGFGAPALKMDTYNFVANARNMPVKGFKLFYPKAWKSDGFDQPLMTPEQVLSIYPKPVYINYQ